MGLLSTLNMQCSSACWPRWWAAATVQPQAWQVPQGAPQRVQRAELHSDAAGLVREPQVAVPKQLLGQAERVLQLLPQPFQLGVLCAQTPQLTCLLSAVQSLPQTHNSAASLLFNK